MLQPLATNCHFERRKPGVSRRSCAAPYATTQPTRTASNKDAKLCCLTEQVTSWPSSPIHPRGHRARSQSKWTSYFSPIELRAVCFRSVAGLLPSCERRHYLETANATFANNAIVNSLKEKLHKKWYFTKEVEMSSAAGPSTSGGSQEAGSSRSSRNSQSGSSELAAPPPPPLESLFAASRTSSQVALLCLYFPIGIILALLRFFICLHAFLVTLMLPKTSKVRCCVVRVMCTVLGLVVVEEDKNRDPDVKVFVANHVSIVDHWLLDVLTPCVLPSVWDLPSVLNWGHIYKEFGSSTQPVVSSLKQHLETQSTGLLCFPEVSITNGSALLKFSQLWPFELGAPVQAVAIKATRTLFRDLALSTLESTWLSDMLWMLFSPWTTFRVSRLPAVRRGKDDTAEEFAARVAEMLAAQLGVKTTPHTYKDKLDIVKRRRIERVARERRAEEAQALANPELMRMAGQVKEVLPDVPLAVIARDLQETRSVDSTISRLVDGIVHYVPEKVLSPQPRQSTSTKKDSPVNELVKNAENAKVMFNTSASNFGSTAEERFASYQERKARLIENARLKYIQKHKLKL
ncbi:ancient ubiquitous protein 1 homolog isoform X2 [Varroa jacobsoni]|uniref:CUE domain-containing protein n=1 Tax=Varroa destructor TaxID=109461 RepID=A0A7M7KBL6_VARDE|nr:ancient ubiquitous protein 1 homolog isoform X2 [Varroa destructor]XP_022686847.1 ancient ubiquitous protein 1 homolog isoform X2 [Varroa jacobsoni]